MENKYGNEQQTKRKDANKIYFLIAVIVALLGTNAYLFFRDKKASERIVSLSDERSQMEIEIDKIEAQLDKANDEKIKLTAQMKDEQEIAKQKIIQLREQLKKGQLTQGQLVKAREDIKQLRYFVSKYTADIAELQKKNKVLIDERDSLQSTVSSVTAKATELEKQNQDLNSKVKVASALKVADIEITPLKVKNSGKETDVSRANAASKLLINFTVADNQVANTGMHDLFIRIIDPSGNLILSGDSNTFTTADEEQLQYSYRTAIEFSNDGKVYSIEWTNPDEFQKGTYSIILYADGYIMGKGSVRLK